MDCFVSFSFSGTTSYALSVALANPSSVSLPTTDDQPLE
jgi:hypothetical protein